MNNIIKLTSVLTISALFNLSSLEFARSEMIVETKSGQQYTLPISKDEFKSIRFTEANVVNNLWQGQWSTSEGQMNLSQSNNIVQGKYNQDNGRIKGKLDGTTLTGYWIENSSAQQCSQPMNGSFYWGLITFTMSPDGKSFQGKWNYCNNQPHISWTGTKLSN